MRRPDRKNKLIFVPVFKKTPKTTKILFTRVILRSYFSLEPLKAFGHYMESPYNGLSIFLLASTPLYLVKTFFLILKAVFTELYLMCKQTFLSALSRRNQYMAREMVNLARVLT